jgi:hypothetical protein
MIPRRLADVQLGDKMRMLPPSMLPCLPLYVRDNDAGRVCGPLASRAPRPWTSARREAKAEGLGTSIEPVSFIGRQVAFDVRQRVWQIGVILEGLAVCWQSVDRTPSVRFPHR